MTRVALYARVSTNLDEKDLKNKDGEAVKRQDPEVQLIKLRRFAENHGWEVVAEYADRASGADDSRPEFDKMMKAAYKREFDVILVVRIDRIMRSLSNLLNVLNQLQEWKVGLHATDQQIDLSSPTGRLMVSILGALAEWEREIIRERILDGMDKARLKGTKSGRPIGRAPTYEPDDLREAKRLIREDPAISWSELSRRTGMDRKTLRRKLGDLKEELLGSGQSTSLAHPQKEGGCI
jgi:DNA invertase Pin-like site-specific DNA recombinase